MFDPLRPMLYAAVTLLVLCASWLLFRDAAGSMALRRLNLVSWNFYVQFLVLTFVGAVLGLTGISHYVLDAVDPIYRVYGFAAVCYVMIATPLTMSAVQRVFLGGRARTKLRSYFSAGVTVPEGQFFWWLVLSLLAMAATAYVYISIGRIPFLTFFDSSTATDLAVARIEAKRLFEGSVYIRNFFSLGLAPIVSYAALVYAMHYRRAFYWAWFAAAFLVAASALAYSGEKSPVVLYAASLIFVRGFIRGGFSFGMLLLLGAAGLVLITAAYVIFGGYDLSTDLFSGIVGRIFLTQYSGLPATLAVFPSSVPFLRGGSLPEWFSTLIGVEHSISSRVIMELLFPARVADGTAGVMNSLFTAEAWANFGWTGLILSPVLVGTIIQVIYNGLLIAPKTPATLALMAFFMNALPVTGGFVAFLWNPVVLFALILALFVSLFYFRNRTLFMRTKVRYRRTNSPG